MNPIKLLNFFEQLLETANREGYPPDWQIFISTEDGSKSDEVFTIQDIRELISRPAPSDELAWCPTQSGTFTAYAPVWRPLLDNEGKQDSEWQRVPTRTEYDRPDLEVPWPLCLGGVSKTIGLCGHAQAQALAWQFAAHAEARGNHIEVMAQAYKVVYEIKALKI